ncbi:MAG: GMC family oxidoreductase [Myxococcales bacterium]|nr:GMC family oxidoreductase [Myxococcales bacterium]
MPIISSESVQERYDLVIAGTGFGSLFFLHGYLERFPQHRVLLLEWGSYRDQAWQLKHRRNGDRDAEGMYVRQPGQKPWAFTIGFGGGTNCWWAVTPRLAPNDFQLKSRYGVGEDWPITYEELEPYYLAAERVMLVSGPEELARRYPRSGPFPQPPHNLSTADKRMQAASPDHHFAIPTARLRVPVGQRAACCNSMVCNLCPTGAKFSGLNTFGGLVADDRVDLLTNARVRAVEKQAGHATGLLYDHAGRQAVARAPLVAVGCNAIHTPFILMRSGLEHPVLGRYLHEKSVAQFEVLLDGIDHFDGGIPTTACNTSWVDGEHRREAGAAMVYFINHYNLYGLRTEWGRWRQTLPVEAFVEDIPQASNRVIDDGGDLPVVEHATRTRYNRKGMQRVAELLPELLSPLPVERIVPRPELPTGYHIQGTCRMGREPDASIVDADLRHHQVRNLLVLGTAVWPSCGTANPSLTAAALSLRAADRLGS